MEYHEREADTERRENLVPVEPVELPRSNIPPDLAQLMDGVLVLQAQIDAIVTHTERSAANWRLVQEQVVSVSNLVRAFVRKTLENEERLIVVERRIESLASATWGQTMRPQEWDSHGG